MERDEESGFGYHGARYYVPWLGRWTSCDPSGISDDLSLYVYANNSPSVFVDKTGNEGELPINWDETSVRYREKFGHDPRSKI